MKAFQLALLLTFLLVVSAKISITSPITATHWSFGKTNEVRWTHEAGDSGPVDINLFYTAGVDPILFQGSPIVTQHIDDVTKDSAQFDLTYIDKSKYPPTASYYYICIGDAYSSLFTINGGTGSFNSSNSPTSSSSSNSPTSSSSSNSSTSSSSSNSPISSSSSNSLTSSSSSDSSTSSGSFSSSKTYGSSWNTTISSVSTGGSNSGSNPGSGNDGVITTITRGSSNNSTGGDDNTHKSKSTVVFIILIIIIILLTLIIIIMAIKCLASNKNNEKHNTSLPFINTAPSGNQPINQNNSDGDIIETSKNLISNTESNIIVDNNNISTTSDITDVNVTKSNVNMTDITDINIHTSTLDPSQYIPSAPEISTVINSNTADVTDNTVNKIKKSHHSDIAYSNNINNNNEDFPPSYDEVINEVNNQQQNRYPNSAVPSTDSKNSIISNGKNNI